IKSGCIDVLRNFGWEVLKNFTESDALIKAEQLARKLFSQKCSKFFREAIRAESSVNETQHRDAPVGEIVKAYRFPIRIEQRAVGRSLDRWQLITARNRCLVIVVAVARDLVARKDHDPRAQENEYEKGSHWSRH